MLLLHPYLQTGMRLWNQKCVRRSFHLHLSQLNQKNETKITKVEIPNKQQQHDHDHNRNHNHDHNHDHNHNDNHHPAQNHDHHHSPSPTTSSSPPSHSQTHSHSASEVPHRRHSESMSPPPKQKSFTVASAYAYCEKLVKQSDYEGYLCGLLSPQSLRLTLWAIRAFNVETSKVKDVAKNQTIAMMRFQFWRDAVDKIYANKPPHNPVSIALADAIKTHKISKMWFKRIIDEREKNLELGSFFSTQDAEKYAENTFATLLYMTLESAGLKSLAIDHVASHLGKAIGIATLIRGTPFHIKDRVILIPVELLNKHNVVEEKVFRGEVTENFRDAVFEFATLANDHLITARSFKDQIPKNATILFLPAIPCEIFLQTLEKKNFNVFEASAQKHNFSLPYSLLKNAWKRTF